jgi:hypothetical protein
MRQPGKPTAYQQLVRQNRPVCQPDKSAEENLDVLLALHQQRAEAPQARTEDPRKAAVQAMRDLMRVELIPIFENLRGKYEAAGVSMEMDAENFVNGGNTLLIEAEFDTYALRMEGTVTPEGMAFQEVRYSNNNQGALTTGPMLRSRRLTGETFREFVCGRITELVRSAMRRRAGQRPARKEIGEQ